MREPTFGPYISSATSISAQVMGHPFGWCIITSISCLIPGWMMMFWKHQAVLALLIAQLVYLSDCLVTIDMKDHVFGLLLIL